jgi:hypothetical protein
MGSDAGSAHAADGDGVREWEEGRKEGLIVSKVIAAGVVPVDYWGGTFEW